jgi:hypothetical protein
VLDPSRCTAAVLHNRVRACAGWPGTVLPVALINRDDPSASSSSSSSSQGGSSSSSSSKKASRDSHMALKVLRSRVVLAEEVGGWLSAEAAGGAAGEGRLVWAPGNKRLLVPCMEGTWLELLEVRGLRGGLCGGRARCCPGE